MRICLIFFLLPLFTWAQPNCETFLANQDSCRYKACKYVEEQGRYYQFDWRKVEIWKKAIEICPQFAYAYREIGVPFIKSGNFIEWKKYMDLAVEHNPLEYLPVRAALRYKFFADYTGTLEDIKLMEKLFTDIGYSSNGTYHMRIVEGLCYKALGKKEEAIAILEKQINRKGYTVNFYDYLHLGVLYLENKDFQKALKSFEKQKAEYDCAESRYYTALTHKALKNIAAYKENILQARQLFLKDKKLLDPYNELFDQIYLIDIDREIELMEALI
ncbi:MAG: hypothetical protein AAF696_29460 [Bacteroidota bacterium]